MSNNEVAVQYLERLEDLILAMLAYADGSIRGKTRIHKGLFILKEDIDPRLVPAEFEPKHYGPWSREVEEALNKLIAEGLVIRRIEPGGDESPAEVYELTPKGRERAYRALEELRRRADWDEIEAMLKLATKAPLMNLLAYVYLFHPEYAENSRIKSKVNSYVRRRKRFIVF